MKSEDMIRLIKLTAKAPMVELSAGVPNKLMMDERMVNPINNPANTQIWDFVNFQEVLNTSDMLNLDSINVKIYKIIYAVKLE